MIADTDLKEIKPKASTSVASAAHVAVGVPIPKAVRVRSFSPEEWEEFVEEWGTTLVPPFTKVRRFGGSGDMGVDIAAFASDEGFNGPWENHQCKRYGHPLRPSDIWVEIGKIVYHSFKGEFVPPRKHYFICSDDIGTTLEQLLNKSNELKAQTQANWEKHCRKGITATVEIPLEGELEAFLDAFDFSIFTSKSVLDLINAHQQTQYHAVRFGGGLPVRPTPESPPTAPGSHESRYVRQLLDAYGDHDAAIYADPSALSANPQLERDFLRQRERFYHAESLRNFARDTVPEGTFDALQDEVFHGVIDTCDSEHPSGLQRMRATVDRAASLSGFSNPLTPAMKLQDRQGICHQLANDDRLRWVVDDA